MLWVFGTALLVFALMEPYSAWVHRALWHGPLWFIHRTHHRDRIRLSARIDDVANLVPARLTALVAAGVGGRPAQGWGGGRRDAHRLRSGRRGRKMRGRGR